MTMKKEYQNSLEEGVEANLRLAEIAGIVRRQKWLGLWFMPLVFGLFYFIIGQEPPVKLVAAGLLSVLVFGIHFLSVKDQLRRSYRKLLVQAQGTADPVPCSCEFTENQIIFNKLGQEFRCNWENVVGVRQTDTNIEILMKPTGIAWIPIRAFDSPEEIQAWMDFIQTHTTTHQDLPPP